MVLNRQYFDNYKNIYMKLFPTKFHPIVVFLITQSPNSSSLSYKSGVFLSFNRSFFLVTHKTPCKEKTGHVCSRSCLTY